MGEKKNEGKIETLMAHESTRPKTRVWKNIVEMWAREPQSHNLLNTLTTGLISKNVPSCTVLSVGAFISKALFSFHIQMFTFILGHS